MKLLLSPSEDKKGSKSISYTSNMVTLGVENRWSSGVKPTEANYIFPILRHLKVQTNIF